MQTKQNIEKIKYINQDGEIEIRRVISPFKGILSIALEDHEKPIFTEIFKKKETKQFFRNMSKLIETSEAISFQDVFINYNPIIIKENIKSDTSTQIEDGQEPANNIETEIDNKKSDEQSHQFIESAETESTVDDLLQQSQQLQSQQQQKRGSSNIQIKMVDIYKQQEQFEHLVINKIKIEVQDIALVEDYKFSYDTLDLKQMYADKVQKFDTFRGGTKFIYNPRPIIFSESDDKTIDEIMFGAQTAKQSQRKYQDSMKGNPKSTGDTRKMQKSVRFQIEEDKVIEAYVTHWQELENRNRVQQRQEQKRNQITTQYQALDGLRNQSRRH